MTTRNFFLSWLAVSFALSLALLLTAPVWAHGGEEHSHNDAPAALASFESPIPRSTAQSEEFELVAVLANQQLTLYLDHFASNAPVADAQIELESGTLKDVAKQTEPGVYVLPGEAFAQPGKYPLVFSIQTADSADLLTATLEVAQPAAVKAKPTAKLMAKPVAEALDQRIVWGAAAALLLAGVGVFLLRRRK